MVPRGTNRLPVTVMSIDYIWFVSAGILIMIGLYARWIYWQNLRPKDSNEFVGPSYWGVYEGSRTSDAEAELAIHLEQPCAPLHTRSGDRYQDGI